MNLEKFVANGRAAQAAADKAIETAKPKKTLSMPTRMLFAVAAESHVLAEQFGIEPDGDGYKILSIHRPWLTPHWKGSDELQFDPDEYAKELDCCSTYTRHMRLFILNVWNPGYAKSMGWHFNLFDAIGGLDGDNLAALAKFIRHPIWP
jgi:hypothetical protein